MKKYTIHLKYNEDGKTVHETATAETATEALRLCEEELKWESTISAFAVDSDGDLVES